MKRGGLEDGRQKPAGQEREPLQGKSIKRSVTAPRINKMKKKGAALFVFVIYIQEPFQPIFPGFITVQS